MHWTTYLLLGLIGLGALGYAVRRLLILRYLRDPYHSHWQRHARENCFIDEFSHYLFHSRIRARVPLLDWLLLAVGLAGLLPGWFGWLTMWLTSLLDILGLLLVLVALLRMRLWPWSPAWLDILSDSVYISSAGSSHLWFSDSRADFSYSDSSRFTARTVLDDLLVPETLTFIRTREGNMSIADRGSRTRQPKYTLTRADLGNECFDLLLTHLRRTGHIH